MGGGGATAGIMGGGGATAGIMGGGGATAGIIENKTVIFLLLRIKQ